MKRVFKILRRLLLVAAVLFGIGLALWVFVVPGFVEGQIRKALAAAGLPDATFRLRAISLTGAVLTDVRLDPDGRVVAGSISVDYDLASLRASRVKAVVVSGLVARVAVRADGSLDLGPLDDLTGGEDDRPMELPFDRAEIRAATVVIERDGDRFEVPLDATVRPGPGGIAIAGALAAAGRRLRVEGTFDPATGAATATAEIDGRNGESLRLGVESDGPASDGNLTITVAGAAARLDEILLGHRVTAEDLRVDGKVRLAGATSLASADLEVGIASLCVGGIDPVSVNATLTTADDIFDLVSTFDRREQSAGIAIRVPAPIDLAALAETDRVLLVDVAIHHLGGPPPPEAVALLHGAGVEIGSARVSVAASSALTIGPSGWSARIDGSHVQLSSWEVGLPGGATLHDAGLEVRLAGRVAPGEVRLTTVEGCSLGGQLVVPGVLAGVLDVGTAADGSAPAGFEMDGGGWTVRAEGLQCSLDFAHPDLPGLAASSARAEATIRGSVSDRGGDVTVAAGAALSLVEPEAGGVRFDSANASLAAPATAEWGPGGRWLEFDSPQIEIRAAAAAPIEVGDVRVEGLEALILADLGGNLESVLATLGPGTTASATRVTVGGHDLSPLRIGVAAEDPIHVHVGFADGFRAGASGTVVGDALAVRGPEVSADVSSVSLTGAAVFADGAVAAAGAAHVEAAKVGVATAALVLDAVSLDLPFGLGDETGIGESARVVREGSLRTDRMRWRGKDLPPVAIALTREGPEMGFATKWSITETAALAAEGHVRLDRGVPTGEVSLRVPRFALLPDGRISGALTAATGYSFTGEAEVGGRIVLSRRGVVPDLRVRTFDLTATSADGAQSIAGIGADVTVRSLSPFATPGAQRISFREAKLGDIVISDGTLRFQVESPRSILLERAECRLGKTGKFWVYAVRLDPLAPDVDVEMFTEGLSLEDWLSVVTVDNATGTGSLYGRLRLMVRTEPKLSVTLGEGFLHAEGDGTIRILDTEKVREILAENIPRFEGEVDYGALVQDRITQALEDFEFRDLKFDVMEKDGIMTLRTVVAGRGREPPHQELFLTVNLNGFDELIGPALALKLGIDKAKSGILEKLKLE